MPTVTDLVGPAGRLEALLGTPEPSPVRAAVVFAHPHPQHGGTMHNKVIYGLNQTFARMGFSTLRFNFRGVGRSQGSFSRGEGELTDAASALDWAQNVSGVPAGEA